MVAVGLSNLSFAERYRTGSSTPIRDLYSSALSVATEYRRAAGYFSSSALALVAGDLEDFSARGGKMQLVASPRLSEEDAEQLRRGYGAREVIERSIIRDLSSETDEAVLQGLGYLARLIATHCLDVKLAFVEHSGSLGMYHEKLGYFRDPDGATVAFSGSANETASGLFINYESIEVFRSWVEPLRVDSLVADFHSLWSDQTPALRVVTFPDVAVEILEKIRTDYGEVPYRMSGVDYHFPPPVIPSAAPDNQPHMTLPQSLELRPYQREARRSWLETSGRGILEMATGTGKTITALSCAAQVAKVERDLGSSLVTVIIAPFIHLVDQWAEDVRLFGVEPMLAYESRRQWSSLLEGVISSVNLGSTVSPVVITTNATFSTDDFQSQLSRVQVPLLLIGDEVHNLGSRRLLDRLPEAARYRLGLSATPDRWYDDAGTAALIQYFGPTVYEMSLREAMDAGALCRYEYHPRIVELEDDEMLIYSNLTAQIGALLAQGETVSEDPDGPLGMLLRRRSAVLGHARGKLPALRADVLSMKDQRRQLVYCAEGRRPEVDGTLSDEPSQMAAVTDMIGNELGLRIETYVSDTPRQVRARLLKRFDAPNDLQFLAAMRCLDEGVDIPDARVGYLLASSSNPRQFIQRRGRLLRKAPGKDRAVIFDYLAVPPASYSNHSVNAVERGLMSRELTRAAEFADTSSNFTDALRVLAPLKARYNLRHL